MRARGILSAHPLQLSLVQCPCHGVRKKAMVQSLRAKNWLITNTLPGGAAVVSGVIVFIATNAE